MFIIEGNGIIEHLCAGGKVKCEVSRVELGLGSKA